MTSIELANPQRVIETLALGIPLVLAIAAAARVRSRSGLRYRRWALARDLARVLGLVMIAVSAGGLYAVTVSYVPVERASVDQIMQAPSTFIIAVDLSRSMQGDRLEEAKSIIGGMLEALGGNDSVILLGFNASVFEICQGAPPDCTQTLGKLDELAGGRYSAIGDAVAAAASYARIGIPGIVVVVTDGGWNYGAPVDDAVKGAVTDELKVVIIRVGSDPRWAETAMLAASAGADVIATEDVDVEELKELAKEIAVNAKIEAYTSSGQIPVETRDPFPGYLMLLLGAMLLAVGVGGRP